MAEEFEDIAVAETAMEPAAGPATALDVGAVSVDIPAGTSADPVQADEKVFSANPDIGNAEDYNRQQVAEENGMALGNGGVDGRIISEAGRQKAEADKDEKREAAAEYIQQSAARNDFMNKDHDFGGVKMSGHDLDKLMNFYANNPQMMDQLRDRMTKSGMPKDKADKGVKEFQEYMDLKKKEKEGQLTEQDQQRLRELQKSETLKVAQDHAAQLAIDNGLKLSANATHQVEIMRLTTAVNETSSALKEQTEAQKAVASFKSLDDFSDKNTLTLMPPDKTVQKSVPFVAASARDELPQTIALTETFTNTNTRQMAAVANIPSMPSLDESTQIALSSANTNTTAIQKAQSGLVVASL